jgi:hypothetical protein
VGWLFLLWLFVGPIALWTLISPASAWRTLSAWQYRNPDANEPSDAAYGLQRLSALIMLIALSVVSLMLIDVTRDDDARRDRRANGFPSSSADPRLTVWGADGRKLDSKVVGYRPGSSARYVTVLAGVGNAWYCAPTARVVKETATTVEVAVTVQLAPGMPRSTKDTCEVQPDNIGELPLRLAKPLGTRRLVAAGHTVPLVPGR